MKKIFSLLLAFMAISLPLTAQDSNGSSNSTPIILQSHDEEDIPNSKPHRAPMRIDAEAW